MMRRAVRLLLLFLALYGLVGLALVPVPSGHLGVSRDGVLLPPGLHPQVPTLDAWRPIPSAHLGLYGGGREQPALKATTSDDHEVHLTLAYRSRLSAGGLAGEHPSAQVGEMVTAALAEMTREALLTASERGPLFDRVVAAAPRLAWAVEHLEFLEISLGDAQEASETAALTKSLQSQLSRAEANRRRAAAALSEASTAVEQAEAIGRRHWDGEDQRAKSANALVVARHLAGAAAETRKVLSGAEDDWQRRTGDAQAVLDDARAATEAMMAKVLSAPGGRALIALEAVRNFRLGETAISSTDPEHLRRFGSPGAWRTFFLGDSAR